MQARRSTSFNITLLADRILLPFLSGDTPDKPEYDYRLIEVSFPLHPNVHLTYIPCFPCPQKMPNYPWAITPTPWNFMQTAVIPLTFIYPNLQLMPEDSLIIRNRRSLLHRPRPGSCRLLFQSGTLQTSQFLFQLHKYMTFNDLQRIYRNTRAG